MNQYKILHYNDDCCLVALNTVYNIGEVMKDFAKIEMQNSGYNGIIIFDSLLSSISHDDNNRFYCFKCQNGNVDFKNRLNNLSISKEYIKKFNKYFDNNKVLIDNSFLLDLL